MTRPNRRPRLLTPEEQHLWAHVSRGVALLRGRSLTPRKEVFEKELDAFEKAEKIAKSEPIKRASVESLSKPLPLPQPRVAAPQTAAPTLPPLTALERKMLLGLRKGHKEVDAAVDLHGLRQDEAQRILLTFLRQAQRRGDRVVLVVTGKGGARAGEQIFEERGVLRRMVPHWLRLPELRPLVLGFEEASSRHGGSGAIYVRLRRERHGT